MSQCYLTGHSAIPLCEPPPVLYGQKTKSPIEGLPFFAWLPLCLLPRGYHRCMDCPMYALQGLPYLHGLPYVCHRGATIVAWATLCLLPRGYHICMGYPTSAIEGPSYCMGYPMSATEGLGAVCNLCMSLMPWPLFQMKWLFMLPQITL